MDIAGFLTNLQSVLAGKKTYIAAGSAFLSLVIAWSGNKINNQKFIEDTVAILFATGVVKTAGQKTVITDDPNAIPEDVKKDLQSAGVKLKSRTA
jgi:hypothetical protein